MTLALDELAAAFVARTLPKAGWTHQAHHRVGLLHVLRALIPGLTAAPGVVTDPDGGYHETITRFYVWRIARLVEEHGGAGARDIEGLQGRLLAECGAKDLALRWWSRDRLMSVAARRGWLEPDLRPLT